MADIENRLPENQHPDDENHWESCCIRIDKRAVLFFSQLMISLIIIFFCIYQLVILPDCESKTPFMGLLTLVIGVWVNPPTMGHRS